MSYQSPIDVIYGEMQTKLEGDVLQVIQGYDITVDKNELLKALNYDRDQYHKGWSDGYVQANADIVRCKDCKHWNGETHGCERHSSVEPWWETDFCNYGERKDEVSNERPIHT